MTDYPSTLYSEIREVLLASRRQAYSAVNFAMVQAYWQVGRLIVEHEQNGSLRAEYGKGLLRALSQKSPTTGSAGGLILAPLGRFCGSA